ncbi:hypothetical protein ACFZDM_33195 [Streptomyces californicus]|uniref:hypothetical protein n=1 Tax=Streptomyces californicus TaxID=67351 RepID=UPI0036E68116
MRHADLNLLTLRILSNREEFDGYAYFSRDAPAGTAADHEIVCVDLDRDPYNPKVLRALSDRTLRANRFRSGYYLNHIFGEPAYLITKGRRSYVFGRRLERTIWPYFVKRVLTDFAVDQKYLHLKAAGFTLDDGSATHLVGPNAGSSARTRAGRPSSSHRRAWTGRGSSRTPTYWCATAKHTPCPPRNGWYPVSLRRR